MGNLIILKRFGLLGHRRRWHLSRAVSFLMFAFFSEAAPASDSIPADCDTARDRAKSKYGAVRHYFDTFNQCVTRADGDVLQCEAAVNDQQSALGDLSFRSAWPRMFVGERDDQGTPFILPSQHANNVSRITPAHSLAVARAPRPRRG